MKTVRGYAAHGPSDTLGPFAFERRDVGPTDVAIQIQFCGVCHSDLHQVRNEWQSTVYPIVPGHEIVGKVVAVGRDVKRFREGDGAAVGCMVGSCGACAACKKGLEQYCEKGMVGTYNAVDPKDGRTTYGGYSEHIVVDESFTLAVREPKNLAAVAPLLCAGITTWSPLRRWGAGPGKRVGVVGLGGLGHMAVKLAHALGAHVTLFTGSEGKVADGKRLGSDEVVLTRDAAAMERLARSFDIVVDTVSAEHDINAYVNMLVLDGTLVLVGAPEKPHQLHVFPMLLPRRNVAGSCIGGIAETQEMLDFCAERGIASDVEVIPIQKINDAYERMLRSDVKYRFVIDLASLSG